MQIIFSDPAAQFDKMNLFIHSMKGKNCRRGTFSALESVNESSNTFPQSECVIPEWVSECVTCRWARAATWGDEGNWLVVQTGTTGRPAAGLQTRDSLLSSSLMSFEPEKEKRREILAHAVTITTCCFPLTWSTLSYTLLFSAETKHWRQLLKTVSIFALRHSAHFSLMWQQTGSEPGRPFPKIPKKRNLLLGLLKKLQKHPKILKNDKVAS